MPLDARLLLYSTLLTWLMIIVASNLRTRSWTPVGLKLSFGNRHDMPGPSPVAERADRAARNMLENLLLFVALIVAAHLAGAPQERIDLGARVFFYARVLYFPAYLAGIAYLRTLIWTVSVIGLGVIFMAAL
ncbi:MAG TPA: MAPEG family protein [Candidatus Acidoferrum sp.]|nr:MAPEG family protein [Candidatus Acidoferrum sp.]